jgi:hypothetical protein
LLCSCAQDPIFLGIAKEEAPKDPRIPGSPTKLVEFDGSLYVSSHGSPVLHRFKDGWGSERPGGTVEDLASTDDYLYALTSSGLKRKGAATSASPGWSDVSTTTSGYQLVSIYGTNDTLFVGAYKGIDPKNCDYAVFYIEDTGSSLSSLKTGTAFLQGAAWDGTDYYLAMGGGEDADCGVFRWNSSSASTLTSIVTGKNVMGIMAQTGKVLAVARSGELIYGNSSSSLTTSGHLLSSGESFTGAMGVWEKPGAGTGADSLLLLGIASGGTSSTHGYRELVLTGGAFPDTTLGGLRTPGDDKTLSSVDDPYKYRSSIGAHPVTSIIQFSQGTAGPITFAATSTKGLWSYRDGSWNAEP